MSERCPKCFRPQSCCLCRYTKEIDAGIKFVFLMHPKELRKQRTGTGRLAQISLKDAEMLVGVDFTKHARLLTLLSDPQYFPVLLYPSQEAWNARTQGLSEKIRGRTLLAILIDATWFCSRKVIQRSPNLLELPRLSFCGEYRSIFTFKREPKPECVSTIETCYYLIKELQEAGIAAPAADPEPLMTVFKCMIRNQLQAENERIAGLRPNTHSNDWKYTKIKPLPDFSKMQGAE